jgi:tetratricopeptide (TPR) repeat protein
MKLLKTTITTSLAGLLCIAGIKAQSIPEGINHLYAERNKSAKETFEKLVNTNPNNLEAIYWLGQSYIAMNDIKSARDLYSKTLQANGNAPIILVGMGHVNLIDGKKDESRQMFETAINLSTGKKGADVGVLNAIGRANVDAKEGDVAYAIEKLKLAAQKDPKNADVFLNLGDAYRKAHEGGQAVVNYDLATSINPTFARAVYRKAMIYYTQKNWDLYTDILNKAIAADPKFAPAYYELYYYSLGKLDFNTAQNYATKFISSTEQDPQNDYLRIQTLWAQKKYDEAISGAKALVAAAGQQTKPRVYKLLANSYVGKGDTAGAKQYIDEYFAKAKEDEVIPQDYILRGQIGGNDNIVFESYVKAAQMDSVYDSKMKTLTEGVDYFKNRNNKIKEAEMRLVQSASKKTPNCADAFFTGLAFYQGADYKRADSQFRRYIVCFPDSLYGHYYDARANLAMDTTLSVEPYLTNMINGFKKTLDIAVSNKTKFKTQAVASSQFLAAIYNNTKKNRDSAIYFLAKGLEFDPENQSLKDFMNQLQKPAGKPTKSTGQTPGKPTGATKPSAANTLKSSAVKNKTMAVAKS